MESQVSISRQVAVCNVVSENGAAGKQCLKMDGLKPTVFTKIVLFLFLIKTDL